MFGILRRLANNNTPCKKILKIHTLNNQFKTLLSYVWISLQTRQQQQALPGNYKHT